jgi:hypothetical protein
MSRGSEDGVVGVRRDWKQQEWLERLGKGTAAGGTRTALWRGHRRQRAGWEGARGEARLKKIELVGSTRDLLWPRWVGGVCQ